jgi:hypothetical protein
MDVTKNPDIHSQSCVDNTWSVARSRPHRNFMYICLQIKLLFSETQVISIPDLLVPSKLFKKSNNCICIGRGSSQDRPEKMTGPKWQTRLRVTEDGQEARAGDTPVLPKHPVAVIIALEGQVEQYLLIPC